jgi:cobalt/nickel transport system permease protein
MAGQLSLREFFQVEKSQFEGPAHGWRRWDGRVKVVLTLLAMTANVLFARAWLSGTLVGLAALGMLYSRCHWRHILLFLLAPGWAVLVLVLGMSLGFGVQPVYRMGPLTFYQEGIAMGLNAGLRVVADVAWAGLLVITTPFTDILRALRWMRLPEILVDTLSFMYRYTFLLFDEFSAMRNSAKARGGLADFRSTARTSGVIAGRIFLRSYDRADRIQMAMQARGAESASPPDPQTADQ